ncbi:DUF6297 family protein [Cellulomonas composti]|uniref:Uncharacterized protein n=1 Tax=Cellulomonas composti TaxID=266130 RepID=A0A511JAU2_9CELL|nr:DUF6297 family protein [Cellulomonas composti]GEL95107.1 hypothetical protein CCO02nite_17650 [Cellulomonas composti]
MSHLELGEVPTAREIRRFTVLAGNARGGAGIGAVVNDAAYAVSCAVITAVLAIGAVGQLRESLPRTPAPPGSLSLAAVAVSALVAAAGATLGLAARLGPVGLGGPEAAWWLPLPVDRRPLLRRPARRLPIVAAVVGLLLVGFVALGVLGDDPGAAVATAIAAGATGAVLVLAAGLAQSAGRRRPARAAGDAVVAAAPVLALALAVSGAGSSSSWALPWWVAVVAVVLAGAAAFALDARLDRLGTPTLRAGGSVVTQAAGALVSFDSRELGRALTDAGTPARRRRSAALRTVRGPVSALVTADLVVLRRSSWHVVQLVGTALVPVLATRVPQLAGVGGVLVAVLVAGFAATTATAEGARRAEASPALDRLLPLDARSVRQARMVVPWLAMTAWSVPVFVAVGMWAHDVAGFLALGLVAVPVWAAGAVRAAYRPAPNWDGPLVATPAGALPGGLAGVLARGPDVVVLGLLPLWVALGLRTVTPTMLLLQAVAATIAVAVGSSTSTRTLLERIAGEPTTDAGGRP